MLFTEYVDLAGLWSDSLSRRKVSHRDIFDDLKADISLEGIAHKSGAPYYKFDDNAASLQDDNGHDLARKGCQFCHGKGLVRHDFPNVFVATSTCPCVDRKRERNEYFSNQKGK